MKNNQTLGIKYMKFTLEFIWYSVAVHLVKWGFASIGMGNGPSLKWILSIPLYAISLALFQTLIKKLLVLYKEAKIEEENDLY